jgi:hypothetical protein
MLRGSKVGRCGAVQSLSLQVSFAEITFFGPSREILALHMQSIDPCVNMWFEKVV